jgi:hypothetical protein
MENRAVLGSKLLQQPGPSVARLRWLSTVVCFTTLITLTGCTGALEVTDTTERQKSETPISGSILVAEPTIVTPEHNVGVVGIDFDPSLEYQEIVKRGSLTLLVAVENRGLEPENMVEVHARLFVATSSISDTFSVEGTRTIDQISPGEVTIVDFEGLSHIPIRSQYKLEVSVEPIAGESVLSDNVRNFDISVNGVK